MKTCLGHCIYNKDSWVPQFKITSSLLHLNHRHFHVLKFIFLSFLGVFQVPVPCPINFGANKSRYDMTQIFRIQNTFNLLHDIG